MMRALTFLFLSLSLVRGAEVEIVESATVQVIGKTNVMLVGSDRTNTVTFATPAGTKIFHADAVSNLWTIHVPPKKRVFVQFSPPFTRPNSGQTNYIGQPIPLRE